MYRYFAELYKKHQHKIIPIVIYSHDAKIIEPDSFIIEFPFLKTLEFKFFRIQLRKESWKKFIKSNNPVAAALISKMDWTEKEKIEVKIEFLVTFFETYLPLTENEEEIYRKRLKNELGEKEVEKCMEFVSSYRLKGRAEGIEIGRIEGKAEAMREVVMRMLSANILISRVKELTGLSLEEIQTLKQEEEIIC
ncbi:MAG: hypothetical protein KAX49_16315 [Halanaerobiales bacterium]|nr:hypothetical protein [Halanaerobiales bacterium]